MARRASYNRVHGHPPATSNASPCRKQRLVARALRRSGRVDARVATQGDGGSARRRARDRGAPRAAHGVLARDGRNAAVERGLGAAQAQHGGAARAVELRRGLDAAGRRPDDRRAHGPARCATTDSRAAASRSRCSGVGLVGAVAVSGVPQREDHAIVVEALAALAGVPLAEVALDCRVSAAPRRAGGRAAFRYGCGANPRTSLRQQVDVVGERQHARRRVRVEQRGQLREKSGARVRARPASCAASRTWRRSPSYW